MENGILDKIRSVSDVNTLDDGELISLCEEIREEIVRTVNKHGGHLSSALGAVEAIVALCSVYDFSKDKIFFDVGHQSYAFKLLNIGREAFSKIRTEGGASGFCGDDKNSADGFTCGKFSRGGLRLRVCPRFTKRRRKHNRFCGRRFAF